MKRTKGDWAYICVSRLLEAYAKVEIEGGSIDWSDLDQAFEAAKKAYSIPYRRFLKLLKEGA